MKQKRLMITTIVLFLCINTKYFWQGKLGILAFPVLTLFMLIFLVLAILLLRQIVIVFQEKYLDKQRIYIVGMITVLLLLLFLKPNGIINFDKLQGEDLLIAQREGAANCNTTLKLKENNTFIERSVCFGMDEIKGKYNFRNDTIFFNNVSEKQYFKFAVIKKNDFIRYKNASDTIPSGLYVTKNLLKNK